MSYIRRPKFMNDLFGDHVPMWQRLLTMITFPIWGMIAVIMLVLFGVPALIGIVASVALDILDNITDK